MQNFFTGSLQSRIKGPPAAYGHMRYLKKQLFEQFRSRLKIEGRSRVRSIKAIWQIDYYESENVGYNKAERAISNVTYMNAVYYEAKVIQRRCVGVD